LKSVHIVNTSFLDCQTSSLCGESIGAVSDALHEAHEALVDQGDPALFRSPLRQHGVGGLALADSDTLLNSSCATPLHNTEYDHFDIALSNLTKACFIEKVFELTLRDENQVMAYRSHQAVRAKQVSGCPAGRLMTRKSTDRSNSVSKYVHDCYTLYMFIRGDTSGDIEKVFSRQLRCTPSTTDITQTGDSLHVRNTLIEVQAELSALRSCVGDTESLKETVSKQKRLIDKLRVDYNSLQSKVIALELELNTKCTRYDALSKLTNERLDSLEDASYHTNDGEIVSAGAELSRLQGMHGCLSKKVKGHITDCNRTTPAREQLSTAPLDTSIRTPPKSASSIPAAPEATSPREQSVTNQQLINSTNKQTGQSTVLTLSHCNIVKSTGLTSSTAASMYSYDQSTLAHNGSPTQVSDHSNGVIDKDHSTELDLLCVKCQNETSGAHRCDVCNKSVHIICGTQIGEEGYGSSVRCDMCSQDLQDNTCKATYSSKLTHGTYHSKSDTGTHKPPQAKAGNGTCITAHIPVVINRYVSDAGSNSVESRKHAQRDDGIDMSVHLGNDDNMFEGVGRKGRTRRYYIGGIRSNSTRQGMCNYLAHKNIHPTAVRVMSSGRGCLAAKITVAAFEGVSLEDKQFWSSGINCRRWYGETARRGSYT
jgi:hypothetical protein